jgi:PII-like signaling protein
MADQTEFAPAGDANSAGESKTLTLTPSGRRDGNASPLESVDAAAILQEVAAASRERQEAEHRLSDRMQELSSQGSASQWSAAPAHVVTRLGGTPRTHTILLAALLATALGVVIFRAAEGDGCVAKIHTTSVLASSLELPVIGNLLAMREAARQMRQKFLTPQRLHYVVVASEVVVGIAALACAGAIFCEPALARQVVADPFGALSEVVGRFGH